MLLPTIPIVGPTLSAIADFLFVESSITTVSLTGKKKIQDVDVQMVSLSSRISVKASAIVAGSRDCIPMDTRSTILCQYSDIRVQEVKVELFPSNVESSRSGTWHIGLQPYFHENDIRADRTISTDFPSAEAVHRMFKSSTAPADKPLRISYSPKVSDGRAYGFIPLDTPYMDVAIVYDQPVRQEAGHFTQKEFACDVRVSGRFELRMAPAFPDDLKDMKYTDFVIDRLTTHALRIWSVPDAKHYMLTKDGSDDVKSRDGSCKVSGNIEVVRPNRRQFFEDDMEIV